MSAQLLPTLADDVRTTLIASRGAHYIDRNELSTLPTPLPTDTWRPVPHAELVTALHESLDHYRVQVRDEQYAVSHDGAKLFGTLRIDNLAHQLDYGAAIGLRASNDKSMSIQIAVGAHVFVCSNLCFSGSEIALKRKHTAKLDVTKEVQGGVERYLQRYDQLESSINKLKALPLRTSAAEHMIFHAFDKEILPIRLYHAVIQSWRDIRNNGVVSQWQLQNCFTLHAHKLQPQRRYKATLDIGRFFHV